MSTNPLDISIATEAANIVKGFPATDLVEALLRHIALDIGKYARDVRLSSQVYARSHRVYNTVQELIKKVVTSETLEWDAFEQFTLAITPLEKYSISKKGQCRN